MNIVHIVLNLECGGLEKLVIDLVRKLHERGVKTGIICLEKKGILAEMVEREGIEVHELSKKDGLDLSLIFKIAKLLKEKKVNLIHTHNLGPLIYGTLAAKLVGINAVNTRHGRTDKQISSLIWNLNKNVVPVSKDTESHLLKFNRISKEKLKVIYNGVNQSVFKSSTNGSSKEIKQQIGLRPDSFIIGHVGRLAPEKDQKILLKVFKNLIQKNINTELVIVGDGTLRSELEQFAVKLGIADYVKFLGYREDISKLLNIFDIYILPSQREGLSLTILEAMACGKPVVATRIGGSPEAVVDGETGLLVSAGSEEEIENAIIKLYNDRSMVKFLGDAGRQRVKKRFSLDGMALEYEQLYMKALN